MKIKDIRAIIWIISLAIVSGPVMARGGRGGSKGKSGYRAAPITVKAVKSVAKAAAPKSTKQKAPGLGATPISQDSTTPAPVKITDRETGAAIPCISPKPVFDAKRGVCVEG